MSIALRVSVLSLLSLLGLAGLAQWRFAPPLAMRTGAQTDRVLADLASQEAQQDGQARATEVLGRFVGGEITRYFWGGFSGYLDVLGIEAPEDMEARIQESADMVQLLLIPRAGEERYVARVQAEEGVPRGVACRGRGTPEGFRVQRDQLRCPAGWLPLERASRSSRGERS